jgi:hypothetical protein
VERFKKKKDGTVLDTETELTWAPKDNEENVTYDDAVKYCEKDGWRMPTSEELGELYSAGLDIEIPGKTHITLTNNIIWTNDKDNLKRAQSYQKTGGRNYWSIVSLVSSESVNKEDPIPWESAFDFRMGCVLHRRSTLRGGRALRVRDEIKFISQSVLLPIQEERFVKNNEGTVSDTKEGLIWDASDNKVDITYDNATKYCIKDGWRMPMKEELLRLYSAGLRRENSGETKISLTGPEVWAGASPKLPT